MSLLIKALDKAQAQSAKVKQSQNNEADKPVLDLAPADIDDNKRKPAKLSQTAAYNAPIKTAQDMDLGLSLSVNSVESSAIEAKSFQANAIEAKLIRIEGANQKSPNQAAANVFSSKYEAPTSGNKRLAIIAGTGFLALLAMGGYFYQFIDTTPITLLAKRPTPIINQAPVESTQVAQNVTKKSVAPETIAPITNMPAAPTASLASARPSESIESTDKRSAKYGQVSAIDKPVKFDNKSKKSAGLFLANDEAFVALANKNNAADDLENSTNNNSQDANLALNQNANQDGENDTNEQAPTMMADAIAPSKQGLPKSKNKRIASESASINVTKTKVQNSINPVLMSAYEAYNIGDDATALKLYKQVLQRDVHNVDALLGLGAIAQRQGRTADANGWYGKVLEVEPKNSIAMTSILDSQPQNDVINTESRIKNMLAKQPNDANLQASLGNFYAETKQWPSAQQAYFDAYRLNASADNALNLAVSLDQMGKPKLALPYYLRALEQTDATSNIDKTAIEARIKLIK